MDTAIHCSVKEIISYDAGTQHMFNIYIYIYIYIVVLGLENEWHDADMICIQLYSLPYCWALFGIKRFLNQVLFDAVWHQQH